MLRGVMRKYESKTGNVKVEVKHLQRKVDETKKKENYELIVKCKGIRNRRTFWFNEFNKMIRK